MARVTTKKHELESFSPEYMSLADVKAWTKRVQQNVGVNIPIYEEGVSLSAKNRPTFKCTKEMVAAGSIQHRYHGYRDDSDKGYYVFVIERPMSVKEQADEDAREAKRIADQAEYDKRQFEALKAKGFK